MGNCTRGTDMMGTFRRLESMKNSVALGIWVSKEGTEEAT